MLELSVYDDDGSVPSVPIPTPSKDSKHYTDLEQHQWQAVATLFCCYQALAPASTASTATRSSQLNWGFLRILSPPVASLVGWLC